MTVYWGVAPCSLDEVYGSFGSAYCLHVQGGMMMKAGSTSETSLNFYRSTRQNIPEDIHLHTRRCENLKIYDTFSTIHKKFL
jgi:hypothetical protein